MFGIPAGWGLIYSGAVYGTEQSLLLMQKEGRWSAP